MIEALVSVQAILGKIIKKILIKEFNFRTPMRNTPVWQSSNTIEMQRGSLDQRQSVISNKQNTATRPNRLLLNY